MLEVSILYGHVAVYLTMCSHVKCCCGKCLVPSLTC